MLGNIILVTVVWTFTLLLSALVSVIPVWLLWNALLPKLFGLSAISLLQAFGLVLLAGLLFGDRLSVSMRSD